MFDTVDHDVLVERLARTYDLRSTALNRLRSYLLDRRQSVYYGEASSSVRSLVCFVRRDRRLVRCYSCFTRPTLVSWLLVSAYHHISMPMTRNSTRGAILHLADWNGVGLGWSWASSGLRSGRTPNRLCPNSKKRSLFGAQLADDVLNLTRGNSTSAAP